MLYLQIYVLNLPFAYYESKTAALQALSQLYNIMI
jgi:hypothetical protein